MVVIRVKVTTKAVSVMPSQPCGKCVEAISESGSKIHRVVWSCASGCEACPPCEVPPNQYRAKNGAWKNQGSDDVTFRA